MPMFQNDKMQNGKLKPNANEPSYKGDFIDVSDPRSENKKSSSQVPKTIKDMFF